MNIAPAGISEGMKWIVEHPVSSVIVCAAATVSVCLHEVPLLSVDNDRLFTVVFNGAYVQPIAIASTLGYTFVMIIKRVINCYYSPYR